MEQIFAGQAGLCSHWLQSGDEKGMNVPGWTPESHCYIKQEKNKNLWQQGSDCTLISA